MNRKRFTTNPGRSNQYTHERKNFMTSLKHVFSIVLLAVFSLTTVAAQTPATKPATQEPKPATRQTTKPGTVVMKATIEAIDTANRTVTFRNEKGKSVKVKVDPSVKRFDQLKVGDVITAAYSESVIIRFRKPGDPAPAAEKGAIASRAEGKPGAAGVIEETLTVTIEEIDLKTPSVTVRGPEGNLYTHRVRDAKTISGLKVGDKADIVYRLGVLLKADAAAK
jgi:Cu/Ag efflux protein CusF